MENIFPQQGARDQAMREAQRVRIKALVWLVCGIALFIGFFLPNYTIAFMDVNGVDLIRILTNDPEKLAQLADDFPSLMMVVTPFVYWLLGFLSIIFSIFLLAGNRSNVDLLIIISSIVTFFLAVFTAILLNGRANDNVLVSKMAPRPQFTYYLMMLFQLGIGITGFAIKFSQKNRTAIGSAPEA